MTFRVRLAHGTTDYLASTVITACDDVSNHLTIVPHEAPLCVCNTTIIAEATMSLLALTRIASISHPEDEMMETRNDDEKVGIMGRAPGMNANVETITSAYLSK